MMLNDLVLRKDSISLFHFRSKMKLMTILVNAVPQRLRQG